jgi:galactoside O-acetyltransferase
MDENIFFDRSKLKYCGENVIIGKTVRIRKPEECSIGDNTIIDDFTYISCPIQIGKNCHISSNINISGGAGYFEMDDYSTLSSHVSIHTCSSDYINLSLDLPSVPEEMRTGGEIGLVKIGKFVTVGSHSVILPNAILQHGTSFGAFSLIKDIDYKQFTLYIGNPVRIYATRNYDDLLKNNLFSEEFFENLKNNIILR